MATVAWVVTIAVVLLGLIAFTKTSFDEIDATVRRTAETLLEVDRAPAEFGPDAQPLRARLKHAAAARFDGQSSLRAETSGTANPTGRTASFDDVIDGMRRLQAQDDHQRALQTHALERTEAFARADKVILAAEPGGVSPALVAIVVFWLAATFAGYALYRRAEVKLAGPLLGALVAAGALFLTIELATPLRGALQVSQAPLQRALEMMNAPPK